MGDVLAFLELINNSRTRPIAGRADEEPVQAAEAV